MPQPDNAPCFLDVFLCIFLKYLEAALDIGPELPVGHGPGFVLPDDLDNVVFLGPSHFNQRQDVL